MRDIQPAKEHVLCEPTALQRTQSGLVVAEGEERRYRQPVKGRVLTIGSGKTPVSMTQGDIICFLEYAGNEVEIEGKKYYFVKFADILGVIKNT